MSPSLDGMLIVLGSWLLASLPLAIVVGQSLRHSRAYVPPVIFDLVSLPIPR